MRRVRTRLDVVLGIRIGRLMRELRGLPSLQPKPSSHGPSEARAADPKPISAVRPGASSSRLLLARSESPYAGWGGEMMSSTH
jgi:hypothetical protein